MKKNFFKKLSFVMALAMLISVIAPAAGAFAATSPKLNAASKTLLLGNADRSGFDFNVVNKVSGASYKWASSKTSVASVDQDGYVSSVATGTTTISVKITKKGMTTKTLSASVTVKSNIASLAIVAPKDTDVAKLAVGTDYDFGRTYKTESGATTGTTSVTRWLVTEGATITDAGVFNASKAGKYTITAVAFQSKAKYNAWVAAGKDLKSSSVLASTTLEVTVADSIKEVKQLTTTSFKVVFASDMTASDVAKKGVLSRVVNGASVTTGSEKIKSATLDATGKVLTVVTYAEFTASAVYNFTYNDVKGSFTAATTNLSDVKSIVFKNMTVNVDGLSAPNMKAYVAGLNADGVEIIAASATSTIAPYLTFKYNGDLTKGYISGDFVYIYTSGYSADITATYANSAYNTTTKTYETATYTAVGTATGVAKAVDAASLKFAILSASGDPTASTVVWSASPSVAAKDTGYKLYTKFKNNTDLSTADYTLATSEFTYESSNTDKLIVTGNTLLPVSEGTVTVIVKSSSYPYAVVGTVDVVVKAARTFPTPVVYTQGPILIANSAYYAANGKSWNIIVNDSLGERISSISTGTITMISGPTGTAPAMSASYIPAIFTSNSGLVKVTATGGVSVTPGAYNFNLPITATINGVVTTQNVVVNVIVIDAAANPTVVNWKVDLSSTEMDVKSPKYTSSQNNIKVTVNAYNSAGIVVDSLESSEYTVSVKSGETEVSTAQSIPVIGTTAVTGVTIAAKNSTAATPILYNYLPGTYSVTVALTNTAVVSHASLTGRLSTSTIGVTAFTVKDTTTKTVTSVAPVVTYSAVNLNTVLSAVKAAYDFTLNGASITEANITSITYYKNGTLITSSGSEAISANDILYIVSVEYSVANPSLTQAGVNPSTSVYTYDVAGTITVK